MKIETLWGARKGYSTPELMEAWDEYSIDEHRQGWDEACQKAIASWGDDLDVYRYIEIHVNEHDIDRAFNSTEIQGVVKQ